MVKGSKHSEEAVKKNSEWHKGKKMSEKARIKMSRSRSGERNWNWKGGLPHCLDCGKKLTTRIGNYCIAHVFIGERNSNIGKHRSEETKKKMSLAKMGKFIGDKSPHWQGGITPINTKIRNSLEYKLWRTAVFARDNFTCIWCGDDKGGNLEADHIKPFALFPELRFAIDNGRTLCIDCHRKTDTYGGKTR